MSSLQQLLPAEAVESDIPKNKGSDILSVETQDYPVDGYASYTELDDDLLEDFTDADEQCVIEEAIVMNAKEVHKKEINIAPPVIPQRNRLRSSKLLANLKLDTMESTRQSITTSHDIYMSSEEDVSSSADDFSDYDYESDSEFEGEVTEGSPARRKSREDTARAVSVVFVGRPSVVELSKVSSPLKALGGVPKLGSLGRPSSYMEHPPRRSSLAPTAHLTSKPAFLNTDPFAAGNYASNVSQEQPSPISPGTVKAPTKVLHRFSKSLSLARKRSRPNLRDEVAAERTGTPLPVSNSTLTLDTTGFQDQSPSTEIEPPASPTTPQTPVTYREIIKIARKNSMASLQVEAQRQQSFSQPQTPSPSTPVSSRRFLGGFNLGRRRSIKARSITLT